MLVRFVGFTMASESTGFAIHDYIDQMKGSGYEIEGGEHGRIIYFNDTHSTDYFVGLLVTVKDQRTYCKLINESGKLHVEVTALDSGANLMDFNFFVINKATGAGLYQHYHQSCSINLFGAINSRRFSELRTAKLDQAIALGSQKTKLKRKDEKSIRSQYKGNLQFEVLVRKENLNALIEELARVQDFEFSFSTLTTNEPEFKPLDAYVRKERHSISFTQKTPVSLLSRLIPKIIKAKEIEEGKVTGVDANGITRILRITDNPDNFGEYDYDAVAPKINDLNIDEFERSWVIKELIAKCKANRHIFEVLSK